MVGVRPSPLRALHRSVARRVFVGGYESLAASECKSRRLSFRSPRSRLASRASRRLARFRLALERFLTGIAGGVGVGILSYQLWRKCRVHLWFAKIRSAVECGALLCGYRRTRRRGHRRGCRSNRRPRTWLARTCFALSNASLPSGTAHRAQRNSGLQGSSLAAIFRFYSALSRHFEFCACANPSKW